MDSEDDAYDPWPDCIMDRTGCHCQSYYHVKYVVDEQFAKFFNIDISGQYTKTDLDRVIIDYIEQKHGESQKTNLAYDEPMWNLFDLDKTKTLKFYQLERNFRKFITRLD